MLLVQVHRVCEVTHVLLRADQALWQQDAVQLDELLVAQPDIVASPTDSHRLQHASVAQLRGTETNGLELAIRMVH